MVKVGRVTVCEAVCVSVCVNVCVCVLLNACSCQPDLACGGLMTQFCVKKRQPGQPVLNTTLPKVRSTSQTLVSAFCTFSCVEETDEPF